MKKLCLLLLCISILTGCFNSNNKHKEVVNQKESNKQMVDVYGNINHDGEYWISRDEYDYGIYGEIIIPDIANAFQFYENNTCHFMTINDNTNFWLDNHSEKTSELFKNKIKSMYGIWFSDIQDCTYEIRNEHIYINLNDLYGTVLNGEYQNNEGSMEIIWNGSQRKDIYDKITINEDFTFEVDHYLNKKELFLYDNEKIEFDVYPYVRKEFDGSYWHGLDKGYYIQNIINSNGLDVTISEFYDFNRYMLLDDNNYDSLEYRIFTGALYSNGRYEYAQLDFSGEEYENLKGKKIEVYAPKRKLKTEEIASLVSQSTGLPVESINVPDDVHYLSKVQLKITDRDMIHNYLYSVNNN